MGIHPRSTAPSSAGGSSSRTAPSRPPRTGRSRTSPSRHLACRRGPTHRPGLLQGLAVSPHGRPRLPLGQVPAGPGANLGSHQAHGSRPHARAALSAAAARRRLRVGHLPTDQRSLTTAPTEGLQSAQASGEAAVESVGLVRAGTKDSTQPGAARLGVGIQGIRHRRLGGDARAWS